MIRDQKVCRRCIQFKFKYEFNFDKSRYDGRSYICKECDKKKSEKYYKKFHDAVCKKRVITYWENRKNK